MNSNSNDTTIFITLLILQSTCNSSHLSLRIAFEVSKWGLPPPSYKQTSLNPGYLRGLFQLNISETYSRARLTRHPALRHVYYLVCPTLTYSLSLSTASEDQQPAWPSEEMPLRVSAWWEDGCRVWEVLAIPVLWCQRWVVGWPAPHWHTSHSL